MKIIVHYSSNESTHSVTFILDEDRRGSAVSVALRDLSVRPVKTSRNVKRSSRSPGKRQRGIFARSHFLGVDRNKFKFTESQNGRTSLRTSRSTADRGAIFRGRAQRHAADYSRNFQSRRVTRERSWPCGYIEISIFRYTLILRSGVD